MELQRNNITFGAKTLYPIKIKKAIKGGYRRVKANFAELSTRSETDKKYIQEIQQAWQLAKSRDNYIGDIACSFRNDANLYDIPEYKYFITRLASKNGKMSKKIASIIAIKLDNKKRNIILEYIQSASQVKRKSAVPQVKGAGELAILGLIKYAKEHGFRKIVLNSTNDDFYDKLGFKKIINKYAIDDPDYKLTFGKFEPFIRKISEKYGIK